MKNKILSLLIILFLVLNIFLIPLISAASSPTNTNTISSNPTQTQPSTATNQPTTPTTTINPGAPPGSSTPQIPGGEIDPQTGLPRIVETFAKIGENLSDDDKRTAYLKAEWQKILEKSATFGPIIKFLYNLNPVSQVLLGMDISFSYYFFLALLIWITLVIWVFRCLSMFSNKSRLTLFAIAFLITMAISFDAINTKILLMLIMTAIISWILISMDVNPGISIFISLGFSFLSTTFIASSSIAPFINNFKIMQFFGIPKFGAMLIIKLISAVLFVWWMQFIVYGLVVFVFILSIWFSKQIEIMIKAMKEKNKKKKEELDKQIAKNNMETLGKLADTIKGKSK